MTQRWNVANIHCSASDARSDLESECMRTAGGAWREEWVWNLGHWYHGMILDWVCLRTHTVKENAEALILARKESGEVHVDKTKYLVMCWDQNSVRSHSM